jgi:hypothetical protein
METPTDPNPSPRPSRFTLPPWSSALAIRIVSVFGGGLVLTAAIAGAAARWGSVSVTVRLMALAVVLVGITAAAEYVEGRLEILGRVLSHLAAALVLPVAVVTTAQLGGSWRVCTLVGGIVGALAVEGQGRRRHAPLLHGATAIGAVVASGGLSALIHVPVAVCLGTLAIAAAAIGFQKRAILLVTSAVAAPIVGLLTTYQIGTGTLVELGLKGQSAMTGASIGGALAAVAFGGLWFRQRRIEFVAGAACALTSSVVATLLRLELKPDAPLLGMIVLLAFEVFVLVRDGLASTSDGSTRGVATRYAADLAEIFTIVAVAAVTNRRLSPVLFIAGASLFVGALRRREVFGYHLPTLFSASFVGVACFNASPFFVAIAASTAVFAAISVLRRDLVLASAATFGSAAAIVSFLVERRIDHLSAAAILGVLGVAVLASNALLGRRIDPAATFAISCLAAAPWFLDGRVELGYIGASSVVLAFALTMRFRVLAVCALGTGMTAVYVLMANHDLSPNWRAFGLIAGTVIVEETLRLLGLRLEMPRHALALLFTVTYLTTSPGLTDRLAAMVILGIVLTGFGAIASHRPALWSGVIITSTAIVAASSPTLSELPVWAWALAGGLALLGLGAGLEVRKNRALPTDTAS